MFPVPLNPISQEDVDAYLDQVRTSVILRLVGADTPETAVKIGYWEIIQRLDYHDKLEFYPDIVSALPPESTSDWPNLEQVRQLINLTSTQKSRIVTGVRTYNVQLHGLDTDVLFKLSEALKSRDIVTMYQLAQLTPSQLFELLKTAYVQRPFGIDEYDATADFLTKLTTRIQQYIERFNELERFIPPEIIERLSSPD